MSISGSSPAPYDPGLDPKMRAVARRSSGSGFDRAAFGLGLDRTAQRDLAVDGDDLDVLGSERQ